MNCTKCSVQLCQIREKINLPDDCPGLCRECIREGTQLYSDEDIAGFYADSLKSMGQSFGKMPRIIEAVNFCKIRGFHKIGVAYCSGMFKYGKIVADIFESYGFEVSAYGCKTGGFSANELVSEELLGDFGKDKSGRAEAGAKPRAICNPIGQALFLNKEKTEFNVIVGLCVGHDSLFNRYSEAMSSTVVLKDRAFTEMCAESAKAAASYGEL